MNYINIINNFYNFFMNFKYKTKLLIYEFYININYININKYINIMKFININIKINILNYYII